MAYHNTPVSVAPGAFRAIIRRAAGAALRAEGITAADAQLMRDLRRDEPRRPMAFGDRLLDLLARVPEEHEALALADELRGAILAGRRRNDARSLRVDAIIETATQADADVAVMRVLAEPNPDLALVQDAIHATSRHKSAVERLFDDLFVARYDLAQAGR